MQAVWQFPKSDLAKSQASRDFCNIRSAKARSISLNTVAPKAKEDENLAAVDETPVVRFLYFPNPCDFPVTK